MGEEEKIEKNKSLYLYCVLETIHPSARKHSFIREKKTQKSIQIWEKNKRSARRTKASTFTVFLKQFIHLTENIHSLEKKNIKSIQI